MSLHVNLVLRHVFFPILFTVLFFSITASGTEEAVRSAAKYLISQQQDNGAWGQGSEFTVNTSEVVHALSGLSNTGDAISRATALIKQSVSSHNDQRARTIAAIASTNNSVDALVGELLAQQRFDGGWGLNLSKQSNALDTVLVLDALLRARSRNIVAMSKAVEFLMNSQQASGEFSLADEAAPNDLILTARALETLKSLEQLNLGSIRLTTVIAKAGAYIESKTTNAIGGNAVETAYVYMGLLSVRQPDQLQSALSNLLEQQRADGSWNGSVFDTAVVLQALKSSLPPKSDLPDIVLLPAALTLLPQSVNTGEDITIRGTAFNRSTTDASNITIEAFAGDPRFGGVQIGIPISIGKIAANGSANFSFTWNTAGLAGSNSVFIFADRANLIREINEANNLVSGSVTIAGVADLELTASDLSSGAASLESPTQVELTARVRNIGTGDAQNVKVRFNEGAVVLGELQLPLLPAKSTFVSNLKVNLTPGNHQVTVTADPDNAVSESNKGNNSAQLTVNVNAQQQPDLAIAADAIQLSNNLPLPNEYFFLNATITNSGTKASGNFNVLVARGDPFFPGAILFGNSSQGSLAPGASVEISVHGRVPAGVHELFVVVDNTNMVVELSEGNNVARKPITTAPLADLTILPDSISISHSNLAASPNIEVSVVIENIGQAASQETVSSLLMIKPGVDDAYILGRRSVPPIPPGGRAEAKFIFRASYGGSYNLILEADTTSVVQELSETNNRASKVVSLARPEMGVALYRRINNQRVPSTVFGAYEDVEIEISHLYVGPTVKTQATLSNEFGGTFSVAPKLDGNGLIIPNVFIFNTLSHRAGNYTLTAVVWDTVTYNPSVIDTKQIAFTVEPSSSIAAFTPYGTPNLLLKGNRSVELYGQFSVLSNVGDQVTVDYTLKSPSGTALTSGTSSATLQPAQTLQTIKLADIQANFTESGKYTFETVVKRDATVLFTSNGILQVEGRFRLAVEKSVEPSVLPPYRPGTVRVKLKVQGVEQD